MPGQKHRDLAQARISCWALPAKVLKTSQPTIKRIESLEKERASEAFRLAQSSGFTYAYMPEIVNNGALERVIVDAHESYSNLFIFAVKLA